MVVGNRAEMVGGSRAGMSENNMARMVGGTAMEEYHGFVGHLGRGGYGGGPGGYAGGPGPSDYSFYQHTVATHSTSLDTTLASAGVMLGNIAKGLMEGATPMISNLVAMHKVG